MSKDTILNHTIKGAQMPRDEIHRAVEEIIQEYAIPKHSKCACTLERIVRMKYHPISPKEVRLVIRNLLQEEGV